MLDWVNKLFRKGKTQGAPVLDAHVPDEPVLTVAPALPFSAAAQKPVVSPPSDFHEALLQFGYENFFTLERDKEPHKLQYDTGARDNYLHCISSRASDLLRAAYAECNQYRAPPNYEWEELNGEMTNYLAAQPPQVTKAAQTLLRISKQYEKAVAHTPVGSNNCVNITVAEHAPGNADAAALKDALEILWAAMPDTDPRLVEGMEYVMETQAPLAKAFENYWWTKNDRRTDYQLAEKVEQGQHLGMTSQEAAAILRQRAENLDELRQHADKIARRTLAWFLSRTVKIDDNYRVLDKSRLGADKILKAMAGGAAIASQADAIRGGAFGPLDDDKDYSNTPKDELRKRALGRLAAAPEYLALATDIASGKWFDDQKARCLALAREITMTPEERAERAEQERLRRQEQIEQAAADATVLSAPVQVNKALNFKRPRVS